MPTIGLDISALDPNFKSHAHRGIGRYVSELKKYFDSIKPLGISIETFDHRSVIGESKITSLLNYLPIGKQTAKLQLFYPYKLGAFAADRFDLLHFPAHMDPPAWGFKDYVVTVLDLIPLVLAPLYKADRAGWRFKFARWLELKAITNARFVLAISENTANDVHNILGIPRERIAVTHLGVDRKFFTVQNNSEDLEIRQKFNLSTDKKLILYVGGIDPRKNYIGLLETLEGVVTLHREKGKTPPLLVIAGSIFNDREFPKLKALIKKKGLEEHIAMPGYVPDEELLRLFSISSAFLFLSLYEGFGLPPLEAMAAGVPVVCSNTSSIPEVVGDSALMVDPKDSVIAAKVLDEVLSNDSLAQTLCAKGRAQARVFTWEQTGKKTLDAYHRALNLNTASPLAVEQTPEYFESLQASS